MNYDVSKAMIAFWEQSTTSFEAIETTRTPCQSPCYITEGTNTVWEGGDPSAGFAQIQTYATSPAPELKEIQKVKAKKASKKLKKKKKVRTKAQLPVLPSGTPVEKQVAQNLCDRTMQGDAIDIQYEIAQAMIVYFESSKANELKVVT